MMNTVITHSKPRYHLIDSLRGFALINMLVFHLLYDIFMIYSLDSGWASQPLTVIWERFICISFIVISGVSLNLSHRAYKHGIIINMFGFLITIVTTLAIPQQAVWFGILNLLGCSMLILQPLRIYLDKIKPAFGMILSLLVFAFTYGVPKRYVGFFEFKIFYLPSWLYQFKWLSFFGFKSEEFFSTDYFPIIPWVFMFAAGYFLWQFIRSANADRYFMLKIPVLDVIGRYSLWIYLFHQPLIMGFLILLF